MKSYFIPLAQLTGAITALVGRDADAATAFVQDFASSGLEPRRLVFAVTPALDSVAIDLGLASPASLKGGESSTLPTWIAAQMAVDVPVAKAVATLGEQEALHALLSLGPDQTTRGVDFGTCWAPIVVLDALKLLGDSWGHRERFVGRLVSFGGHTSIGAMGTGASAQTFLKRHIAFPGADNDAVIAAIVDTLGEIATSTGMSKDVADEHIEFIQSYFHMFRPPDVHHEMSVTLSWHEGMPPSEISLDFVRVPLPFVISFLQFMDQPLASTDRFGTFLGLLDTSHDAEGVSWLHSLSLSFGRHAAPKIRLAVNAEDKRWFGATESS